MLCYRAVIRDVEGNIVIRAYSDHAANERTFLAWVRTGIAVIAFGFVVEKFNLFLLTIAAAAPGDIVRRLQLGPFARYDGLALILLGIVLIIVATFRFLRTSRLIDAQEEHSIGSARLELFVSAALALIVAVLSTYLVFD